MLTIGILAQKGGVGKTTLALHWAVEAQQATGASVAVIDIDLPQCSAAAWAERREREAPLVLKAGAPDLNEALAACQNNGVTHVFIDTMPRVERPCLEAARAADLIVIPCGPSIVDIEAIGDTVSIAHQSGTPAVLVLNQGRSGSSINSKAVAVLEQYGFPICPTVIMRRAVLADAFTDGRAVREIEPAGKAANEIEMSWKWIAGHARKPTKSRGNRPQREKVGHGKNG